MELLIVLSPERKSREAMQFSIAHAKEKNLSIKAVYVVEESITKAVEKEMAETGFIGDKPGSEVTTALNKDHKTRGEKILADFKQLALKFGLAVKTEIKAGFYARVCEELANASLVSEIIFISRKRGFIDKLFGVDEVKQFKSAIDKPVHSYLSEIN
ncbi:MAG: hypothetical protein ACD_73C00768G0003 [uncultured bacterium]|nr:MAG: hypothetical protein ACD_73C00768G0003 [uncultured bacterium]